MNLKTIILLFIIMQISERKKIVLCCGELGTVLIPLLTNTHTTHRWPWHVAIYHRVHESSSEYKCGGTLINSNAVLTAAHCVDVDTERVTVSLGRLRLDASETAASIIEVAEIIRHPGFSSENQKNDIAIILLRWSVTFNNYVQPVCLWREDKINSLEITGKSGTVVGWGRTETGEISKELREAYLPVVDIFACLESNPDVFGRFVSRTTFCAGTRNGTSVCTGDSGGSMTFKVDGRFYIRGVVSVGPSKVDHRTQEVVCDPMQYALFTDVAQYLPWIRSLVKIVECEKKVRCTWSENNHHCTVALHGNETECQIIIDEIPNGAVTELTITGESNVIPELSDAAMKFQNLDSLVLTDVSLKVVEKDRLIPFTNIKKLTFNFNGISQLDGAGTFDDLINLEEISFYDNVIRTLPANIFFKNRKMRKIYLGINLLQELHSDIFEQLVDLETLYLSKNRLETLPTTIFRNNFNLRYLALDFNHFKVIHVDLFKELSNLEIIYLNNNQLETIPAGLFHNNGKLKEVHFAFNQLKEVHIGELRNVEILWLHKNKLERLPADTFHNHRKLQKLSLYKNYLKELHVDIFQNLISLEILHLYDNRLEVLPADIFRNTGKLRQLELTRNQLNQLHVDLFKELYNLELIELSDNQLEIMPVGLFRNNKKLRDIKLSLNKFRKLDPDFLTHAAITKLDIRDNTCIYEECGYTGDSCTTSILSKMTDKIRNYC